MPGDEKKELRRRQGTGEYWFGRSIGHWSQRGVDIVFTYDRSQCTIQISPLSFEEICSQNVLAMVWFRRRICEDSRQLQSREIWEARWRNILCNFLGYFYQINPIDIRGTLSVRIFIAKASKGDIEAMLFSDTCVTSQQLSYQTSTDRHGSPRTRPRGNRCRWVPFMAAKTFISLLLLTQDV